jgi:hypothetical protein
MRPVEFFEEHLLNEFSTLMALEVDPKLTT